MLLVLYVPCCAAAGAGTGKTSTLIARIVHMLSQVGGLLWTLLAL
jgi:superfamily I DNA/RNA helicase